MSRRSGVWTASLTDAGTYYLAHGDYPPTDDSSSESPAGVAAGSDRPRRRAAGRPPTRRASSPAPVAAVSPHLRYAEQAIAQVLEDGAIVDMGKVEPAFEPLRVEQAARNAANLPVGKTLRIQIYGSWSDRRYQAYFEDDMSVAVERAPVPVPGRVARAHPAVAAYKAEADRHEVTRDSLARATRLLQGLALEATSRGYKVSHIVNPHRTHADFQRSLKRGQLEITVGGFVYGIRIQEIAGKGSVKLDWPQRDKLPRWRSIRSYTFVPTGRLRLVITDEARRNGRRLEFEDTARHPVEELLPDLLWELEVRALEDARSARRAEAARAEEEAQRTRAIERAKVELVEAHRLEELVRQTERWTQAGSVRAYVSAMELVVESMPPGEDRDRAMQWMEWSSKAAEDLDPLRKPLATPADPEPTPANLAPFLNGVSFYGR